MPNELELILKAQNGERKAFEELAHFYRKSVTGLAYRMTGRIDVAEEIAQEVFVRVYQALPRFSPDREGAFRAWILTITSRLCIDFSRRLRRQPVVIPLEQEHDLVDYEENISDLVCREDLHSRIREALLLLPENYRVAIMLKYLEDLEYQEIARIMEIPLGTVGTLIRRGLRRLKKSLIERGVVDDATAALP